MSKAKTEFLTHEVLAVAFATHRINDGYYKDTRRFSESPTLFSNKEMLNYQLNETPPSDFEPIKLIDEDFIHAKESVDWLHKDNALGIIAGSLTDFMENIMSSISRTTSTSSSFGLLAIVPKVYFDAVKKKTTKKELKAYFNESKLISTIGSKIEGNFTLQEIKFVDKYTCHVLNGHIEGNLVSFFKSFDQTNELPLEGSTFKIKGKVKRHSENYITKLPETVINYVKIGWQRLNSLV